MQVKLLRVLENKSIVRIGGEKEIPIDVRVIAASNQDIQFLVREKKFRQDLYYRLVVYPIWIPPLRERKEDIKALAEYFLLKNGGDGKVLSDDALRKLYSYDWPGNVRELDSCIKRAIVASSGKELIGGEDIQQLDGMRWQNDDAERQALEEELGKAGGSIKHTARLLDVHRNTVYFRMKKYGIDLSQFRKLRGISSNGGMS